MSYSSTQLFILSSTLALSLASIRIPSLFKLLPEDTSSIQQCQDPGAIACHKIEINFRALAKSRRLMFPGQNAMSRVATDEGSQSITYVFQGRDGSSAYITQLDDCLAGSITIAPPLGSTHLAQLYVVENAGRYGHVLIEESQNRSMAIVDGLPNPEGPLDRDDELLDPSNTDLYHVSVTIYYTEPFDQKTQAVRVEAEKLISIANMGFKDSQTHTRLRLHCLKKLDGFNESNSATEMIERFRSVSRKSADLAYLLISQPVDGTCGIAYVGGTHGLVMKNCPIIVLGHEIGHNFGGLHNREIAPNPQRGNAFGYLMNKPDGSPSGFCSILGYARAGYNSYVNCYSSPDIACGAPLTRTGNTQNNVRAQILQRRKMVSEKGDESETCNGDVPAVPAPPSTSDGTATSPEMCTKENTRSERICGFVLRGGLCDLQVAPEICYRTCCCPLKRNPDC